MEQNDLPSLFNGDVDFFDDYNFIENEFDVIAELNLASSGSDSDSVNLYCSEELSDGEGSSDSNATCSDSLSFSSSAEEVENAIDLAAEEEQIEPLIAATWLALEHTLGLDQLPKWNGLPWSEKDDEAVNLGIFNLDYIKSLWKQFFHVENDNIIRPLPRDECWFPQRLPTNSKSVDKTGNLAINSYLGFFPDVNHHVTRRIGMTHVSKLLFNGIYFHQRNPLTGEYQFYPGVPRCALDLSHLCHNPSCLNPDHLIYEPHRINMNRNVCKRPGHYRINNTLNRNVHRCIHDHFLGGNYNNIHLPDCLPQSAICVLDYGTARKPPTYSRTKLRAFVTHYNKHIKPPVPHLTSTPTKAEIAERDTENRRRKRIQREMYGRDEGEHPQQQNL